MKKRLFVTSLNGFMGRHTQSRLSSIDSGRRSLPASSHGPTAHQNFQRPLPRSPDPAIHLIGQRNNIRPLLEPLTPLAPASTTALQPPARPRWTASRCVHGGHGERLNSGWAPETPIQQSPRAILSDWESRVLQE
ncbi:hypothetical protein F2A38_28460 [Pseudomonas chlororaphis]|uniref:Uncharacterized protein n=1 Tax=Pseudomonas chlororaphis TaxID=587753 RepID=A0AB34BXQ1_9PSED|nr:hypothetical protein F2A38_28460 [Pseudomonas chlororaphis]